MCFILKFLLDTNILIYREDDQIISNDLTECLRLIAKNQLQLFVHPVSITELNKDSNQDRKQKILSKIQPIRI